MLLWHSLSEFRTLTRGWGNHPTCVQLLSQLDRNSNTIRFHHATLRQRAAAAGVEEASAAWSEAMRDTAALQGYASAALTTGEAKWVQSGFHWCTDQVRALSPTAAHFLGQGPCRLVGP